MSILTGFGTVVGLAQEITWGTPVARTAWFPVTTMGLLRKIGKAPRATFAYGGSRNRKRHYIQTDYIQGPVTVEMTYEGAGLWLYNWLGAVATTGPVTALYTHTFTIASVLPPGVTVEAVRGDSGDSEVFAGCKIGKGSLVIDTGKVATLACDIVGKSSAGRSATGSPSYTTALDQPVLFSEAGAITWGAVTIAAITVRKIEVSSDNKIAPRTGFGTAQTAEPVPSGPMDVLIRCELEWSSDDVVDAFLADTDDDLSVTFTGLNGHTLQISGGNCYVEECSDPINNEGIVTQSVVFRTQSVTGHEGLKLILVNSQSSAVAA